MHKKLHSKASIHFRKQTDRSPDQSLRCHRLQLTKLRAGAPFVLLKWYEPSCCSRLCYSGLLPEHCDNTEELIEKRHILTAKQNQRTDEGFYFHSDRDMNKCDDYGKQDMWMRLFMGRHHRQVLQPQRVLWMWQTAWLAASDQTRVERSVWSLQSESIAECLTKG